MNQLIPEGYVETSQPVHSDEVYANVMQEERVKNIIEQSSPDNQLVEIQWRIRGYVKDSVTKQWKKILKEAPEPNPILVGRYISYLSSLLNDNTRWSNLSSDEINGIMNQAIEWLTDDLDQNAKIYGLEYDYSERTRIGHIILNSTFIGIKRAQDGSEVRKIFNSLSMIENNSPQKKEGFMDTIKNALK